MLIAGFYLCMVLGIVRFQRIDKLYSWIIIMYAQIWEKVLKKSGRR